MIINHVRVRRRVVETPHPVSLMYCTMTSAIRCAPSLPRNSPDFMFIVNSMSLRRSRLHQTPSSVLSGPHSRFCWVTSRQEPCAHLAQPTHAQPRGRRPLTGARFPCARRRIARGQPTEHACHTARPVSTPLRLALSYGADRTCVRCRHLSGGHTPDVCHATLHRPGTIVSRCMRRAS